MIHTFVEYHIVFHTCVYTHVKLSITNKIKSWVLEPACAVGFGSLNPVGRGSSGAWVDWLGSAAHLQEMVLLSGKDRLVDSWPRSVRRIRQPIEACREHLYHPTGRRPEQIGQLPQPTTDTWASRNSKISYVSLINYVNII